MNNNRPLHQSSLDLWPGETTAGQVLERIRTQSRDETEKGRWFENLVRLVLLNRPEMEVAEVHRWSEWPGPGGADRSGRTRPGHGSGGPPAGRIVGGDPVQVPRPRAPGAQVGDRLLPFPFAARAVRVALGDRHQSLEQCRGGAAGDPRTAPCAASTSWTGPVKSWRRRPPSGPCANPWALQETAITDVVEGLRNHETRAPRDGLRHGQDLRRAARCGTARARRRCHSLFWPPASRWSRRPGGNGLRHTNRPLDSRVICSDNTAGGRNEGRGCPHLGTGVSGHHGPGGDCRRARPPRSGPGWSSAPTSRCSRCRWPSGGTARRPSI